MIIRTMAAAPMISPSVSPDCRGKSPLPFPGGGVGVFSCWMKADSILAGELKMESKIRPIISPQRKIW